MNPADADADDRDLLHDYLERHEDERCPNCSYRLHRLTGDRCPECGTVLRLSVGRRDTPIGAWLLLVSPLLVASGEGFYNLFWMTSSILNGDTLDVFGPIELVLTGLSFLALLLATAAMVIRPWYVQMPIEVQWALAAPIAVITAMGLMVNYAYYNFFLY